jgi:hypothetical protein
MAVGEAYVEIGVDFQALRRSLARAKDKFADNADAIERDASRRGKGIGSKLGDGLSSGLKVALAGLGALVAGNLLSRIAGHMREIIDLADDIGKSSKRIGITVQEMQKLSHAAQLAGADMGSVEKAMRRMQATVFDAANGLSEANRALGALGLSVDELKGKTPHEQFELIAEALNEVENASDKAAIAQDVFGRAGTALIPMLDNYKAIGDELERVGGIMSGDAVKAAEDFNDALTDLTASAKAAAANSGIIVWLSEVADGLNQIFKLDPADKIHAISAGLMEFSQNLLPGLSTALGPLNKALQGGLDKETITAKELAEARKKQLDKQQAREARSAKRLAEQRKAEEEKIAKAKEKASKEKEAADAKAKSDAEKLQNEERRAFDRHLKDLERAEREHRQRIDREEREAASKEEEERDKAADLERERLDEIRERLREIGGFRSIGLTDMFGAANERALEQSRKRLIGAAGGVADAASKKTADNIEKAAAQQVKNQETQINLQRQTIKAIENKGTGSVFSNQ